VQARARRWPWISILGWYGIAAILLAFFLNSHNMLPVGTIYHLLNITGAIGVILVSIKKRTWQAALLGLVWAYIAISAMRA
jgi:hypothetical protein